MKTNFPLGSGRVAAGLVFGAGLLAGALPAAAQGYTALALSNYGGTNAAYANPSAIADSRYSAYLQLLGGDLNFYNTYLQLKLDKGPLDKGFAVGRQNLVEQGSSGPHFASASAEVRLPSLLLTLGPRSAVAFTSRVRGFVQASNVSGDLARLAFYGLDQAKDQGLANRLLTDNRFNLSADAYHEFAFTYARAFTPNARHFWKAGLTVKYLVGLGSGHALNEGTTFQVYGRDSLQLQTRQLSYGATDYRLYGQSGFQISSLYGSQQLGHGYGADLGLTYEWRPDYEDYQYPMDGREWTDKSRNKYRLRLGLALTDLGALAYDNAQHVRQGQLANTKTVQLGHLDTLRFRTLQQAENTLQRLTGLSSEGHAFTSYLPAALRLTADYRLAGRLYAGLLWTQSLLPTRTTGSRTASTLALVPRLELSHLELALPLLLSNGYRQAAIGGMVRVGPLVVGSDNLGGLFGLKSARGADVYFGLALALRRHRQQDNDHDEVSNKYDKCPKTKGIWATRGCPVPAVEPAPPAAPDVPAVPPTPPVTPSIPASETAPVVPATPVAPTNEVVPAVPTSPVLPPTPAVEAAPAAPALPKPTTSQP